MSQAGRECQAFAVGGLFQLGWNSSLQSRGPSCGDGDIAQSSRLGRGVQKAGELHGASRSCLPFGAGKRLKWPHARGKEGGKPPATCGPRRK